MEIRKIIILVFILAASLRLPGISYPDRIVFDEVELMTYSLHVLHGKPYFYVHPPLVNMMYAGVLKFFHPRFQTKIKANDYLFGDYPYVPLRAINAVAGSLVPVLVFIIVLELWKNKTTALVAALAVATNNALIVYSRLILADTWLLVFGLTTLWLAIRKNSFWSGVFLAMTVAVKWTGLGWGVLAAMFLWRYSGMKKIFQMGLVAFFGYILVWIGFFNLLGPGKAYSGYGPYSYKFTYPRAGNIIEIIKYLPKYHSLVLRANGLWDTHPAASNPLSWVIGGGKMVFFTETNRTVVFMGNIFGWWSVLAGVVWGFVLAAKEDKYKLLFMGYLVNLLPFFVLGRVFFMYHYFSALTIGYVILGGVLAKLNPKLIKLWLAVNLFVFLIISPVTYGLPAPIWWLKILAN